MTKSFELVIHDGKPMRKYENGVIRDEKGIIRFMPSHVAHSLKKGQQDLARLAAIEGMNEATGKPDYYESIKELVKVRTKMALEDTTRAGTEAARLVLNQTGLGQEKITTTNVQGVIQHVPQMSPDYWKALRELQDVEEGEIINDEEE